ncbi:MULTISPECIES: hypothetical protein [Roseobacteraceae]|uniref:hypothetical protein n=1 Tax=Roseobacteraceae TaxID=2854170 RepID=UPI001C48B804|nr:MULTISPECIES: hypothetical protein [Roseobacteraceae]MBV7409026.1 hypothetical protein [Maritimibacter sp. DP1N21-5]MBY5934287.1 hypothetical protein [Tateyamaria omphalii]
MTARTTPDQTLGLVVTPNFVEAEDITDALQRFGFVEIVHCRSATEVASLLEQGHRLPSLALLSFHGEDKVADHVCKSLRDAGVGQILINGDAHRARNVDAVFLQRPYSDQDLDLCIGHAVQAIRAARDPESA